METRTVPSRNPCKSNYIAHLILQIYVIYMTQLHPYVNTCGSFLKLLFNVSYMGFDFILLFSILVVPDPIALSHDNAKLLLVLCTPYMIRFSQKAFDLNFYRIHISCLILYSIDRFRFTITMSLSLLLRIMFYKVIN